MPSYQVDYLQDEVMHNHKAGDVTDLTTTLDSRYLNVTSNLSDLNNIATARTNLGLVAGGAGDIWVEKAGDTMSGALVITPTANSTSTLNVTNTTGASVLNVDSTNQRVGIGTTSPTTTLQVNSTADTAISGITATAAKAGVYGTSGTAAGYGVYGLNNSTTGVGVLAQQSSTGYALYATGGKNYFSGNVGMGMLPSTRALDVTGNVGISGSVYMGVYSFFYSQTAFWHGPTFASSTGEPLLTIIPASGRGVQIGANPLNHYIYTFGVEPHANQKVFGVWAHVDQTADVVQFHDRLGNLSYQLTHTNEHNFTGGLNVAGRVSGVLGFDRFQGAGTRYGVTFTNFNYSNVSIFNGSHSTSAAAMINAATSGVIEVDFNPFVGWTANTSTGYTYPQGQLIISFYGSNYATDITVEGYRPSGGTDSWYTMRTVTGNTATVVSIPISAGDNYVKKMKITMSNASTSVMIEGISMFPSAPEYIAEMQAIPRYASEALVLSATSVEWKDTAWTTRTKINYNVADGGSAVGYLFDTTNALSTSGAKIASFGNNGTEKAYIDKDGNINAVGVYTVDGVQVVGNRVVDARCDDAISSGDATTDGVIDALRDAMITHGLIAAS